MRLSESINVKLRTSSDDVTHSVLLPMVTPSPGPITTERAGHGAVSTPAAHIRVKSRYCVPIIGSLQPPARSTVRPGKVKSYETPDSDRILVMLGRVKGGSNVCSFI